MSTNAGCKRGARLLFMFALLTASLADAPSAGASDPNQHALTPPLPHKTTGGPPAPYRHGRVGEALPAGALTVNGFTSSQDGGQTWSAPVRVNDDPPQATVWNWFGTIGIAPNGRLDVVWNDNRNAISQVYRVETYYSYSHDAGTTWSPSVAITPVWDCFLGFPAQNKIGDYYQLVSDNVGAHLAYAATHNGEQDVYDVRLGEYDCNGNGVPDPQDIWNQTSRDLNGNGVPDECDGLGDLDGNGEGNLGDVNPFVLALSRRNRYEQQYPDCEWHRADCNGDGAANFADINPFVELLQHPGRAAAGKSAASRAVLTGLNRVYYSSKRSARCVFQPSPV